MSLSSGLNGSDVIGPKRWKRKVNNRLKAWGETDFEKKTITIRKKAGKGQVIGHIKNKPGNVLDSIVHEENHRKHPNMKENAIKRKTKWQILKMSKGRKQ